MLRPLNYPADTPGRGANLFEIGDGRRVLVINVMLRLFMDALDDPFAAVEREIADIPLGYGADFILVDMHGEASSEKMAMRMMFRGTIGSFGNVCKHWTLSGPPIPADSPSFRR